MGTRTCAHTNSRLLVVRLLNCRQPNCFSLYSFQPPACQWLLWFQDREDARSIPDGSSVYDPLKIWPCSLFKSPTQLNLPFYINFTFMLFVGTRTRPGCTRIATELLSGDAITEQPSHSHVEWIRCGVVYVSWVGLFFSYFAPRLPLNLVPHKLV